MKTFTLTDDDEAKIAAFQKDVEARRGSREAGAIGGATTYSFTPTSMGPIIEVEHFGEKLDLSGVEDW